MLQIDLNMYVVCTIAYWAVFVLPFILQWLISNYQDHVNKWTVSALYFQWPQM